MIHQKPVQCISSVLSYRAAKRERKKTEQIALMPSSGYVYYLPFHVELFFLVKRRHFSFVLCIFRSLQIQLQFLLYT